jgi:hypothetical protein
MQINYNPNDLSLSNPQLQSLDTKESSFLSKSVKWFRAEDLSDDHKNIRKILAIAIAILLTLTVVGVYWVVEGAMEWMRQDQLFQKKLQDPDHLSKNDAKPISSSNTGKESIEETGSKCTPLLQMYESILEEAGIEKPPTSKKAELKKIKAEKEAVQEKLEASKKLESEVAAKKADAKAQQADQLKIEIEAQDKKANFKKLQAAAKKAELAAKEIAAKKEEMEAKQQAKKAEFEAEQKAKNAKFVAGKKTELAKRIVAKKAELAKKKAEIAAKADLEKQQAAKKEQPVELEVKKSSSATFQAEQTKQNVHLDNPIQPKIETETQQSPKKAGLESEPAKTKSQDSESAYAQPFAILKKLKLDIPEDIASIKQKVDATLKAMKKVPSSYQNLKQSIASPEKLDQLFDEAKILAHHITLKEFGTLKPAPDQYKMVMYPYLDMLVKYLYENKSFPQDPFGWADKL